MIQKDLVYNEIFYNSMSIAADYAASQVLPVILDVIHPTSVIDVGCGAGAWIRALRIAGIANVIGIDGDWVDPKALLIPTDSFMQADLTKRFSQTRRFDLCLSLETAEHLPEERADGFIEDLTRLSDVIVFSAAIPYQGGTNHLNERWQSYWVEKFAKHGYIGIDYIRRRIWNLNMYNTWFYAQNMIIFVKDDVIRSFPELEAEFRYQAGPPISIVHPGLLNLHLPWDKHLTVRSYFRLLPRMIALAVEAFVRQVIGRPPALSRTATPPGAADWEVRKL